MPQDAFHIKRIAEELDLLLKGGKVNRVSGVDKDELTLIIYTGKSTLKLILSTNASNARVCVSEKEREPALIPPNFCMLLRKHLLGAEILGVKQIGFERILVISFHCVSDFSECDRDLYCELMGKYSNLILTENGKIAGALKTTSLETGKRVLFAGAPYVLPEPQDKCTVYETEKIETVLSAFFANRENASNEDLSAFLTENVAGLALPTAREIVRRYDRQNLANGIKEFCLTEPTRPHLLKKADGSFSDFCAFPVQDGIPVSSLNEAEDKFFFSREERKLFNEEKNRLLSSLRAFAKKTERNLKDIRDRLLQAENAEDLRVKGELLTANLYRVERGAKKVLLDNWYDGSKTEIALDPMLSPSENAQRFFKAYNKQKRTKTALLPRLDAEEKLRDYYSSVESSILLAESLDDFKEIKEELTLLGGKKQENGKKRKEKEIPFRTFSIGDFTAYAGRNNLQNDRLLKFARGEDLWFHTKNYHSAHFILRTDGKNVPNDVILRVAEYCAYYSDGKNGDKIPVDYCKRTKVKKPPHAPAGFVIYSEEKTVLVTPRSPEVQA